MKAIACVFVALLLAILSVDAVMAAKPSKVSGSKGDLVSMVFGSSRPRVQSGKSAPVISGASLGTSNATLMDRQVAPLYK